MVTEIGTDLGHAAHLLQQGELVAIPTETVYGLAGNALEPEAVVKIYEAKQRPRFNPLIIHLPSMEKALAYVTGIPEGILRLAEAFSPGPVSYLLPRNQLIPDIVTAGSDMVVVRIPAHPLAVELLELLDFPLAAPSANPFGYVSPVTAQHVYDGLHGRIPYILDGGPCLVGVESTIVGQEGEEIVIYRLGGISAEDITRVTGMPARLSLMHKKPDTPGQLKSHYAPRIPLLTGNVSQLIIQHSGKKIAVISFEKHYPEAAISRVLSPRADLHEAAANLFSALRELDGSNVDIILAEHFPDEGIGRAINDRLSRARADMKG